MPGQYRGQGQEPGSDDDHHDGGEESDQHDQGESCEEQRNVGKTKREEEDRREAEDHIQGVNQGEGKDLLEKIAWDVLIGVGIGRGKS